MIIFMRLFTVYRKVEGQVIIMSDIKLISKAEVCRRLGVADGIVTQYIELGYISPAKVVPSSGRFLFREKDVTELVERINSDFSDYFTTKHAAEELGVSLWVLRELVKSGKIKSYELVWVRQNNQFFKKEDIAALKDSIYLMKEEK